VKLRKKDLTIPLPGILPKFLLDEKGQLVTVFNAKTQPMSDEVLEYLN
jgi:hypothetical protein